MKMQRRKSTRNMFCLLGFIYSLHFLKDQSKLWEFDWILDSFKVHALKNQFFLRSLFVSWFSLAMKMDTLFVKLAGCDSILTEDEHF
jgi:hypothetical protein